MDDLVRWLGEQLDEDERVARAAPPGPWIGTDAEDIGAWSVYDQEWLIASATVYTHDKPMGGKRGPGYIDASATTAHIAAHDPARVLLEVDAKRRLLDDHLIVPRDVEPAIVNGEEIGGPYYPFGCRNCHGEPDSPEVNGFGYCFTWKVLASVYSDRDGYQEAWRP